MFALIKCGFPLCGECLSRMPGERGWTTDQKHADGSRIWQWGWDQRGEGWNMTYWDTKGKELDQSLCVELLKQWNEIRTSRSDSNAPFGRGNNAAVKRARAWVTAQLSPNSVTLGNSISLNLDFLLHEKGITSHRVMVRFKLEILCKAPTIIPDIPLAFNK